MIRRIPFWAILLIVLLCGASIVSTPILSAPAVRPAPQAPSRPPNRAATLPSTQPAADVPTGVLGAGTAWAMPYWIQDSKRPGPTVLVTGGMHGNEPAGRTAADEIRRWTPLRGRLVVIPRTNPASTRNLPGSEGNLNRNFPQTATQPASGEMATALWAFVRDLRPDWEIDLHESIDLRKSNPKATGNTIIYHSNRGAARLAERMCEAVNATIADEAHKFILLKSPIRGGIARSAADLLGSGAMILETTSPHQVLSLRAAQHRVMVHALLVELGMIGGGVEDLRRTPRRPGEIRVALYDGGTGTGTDNISKRLETLPGATVVRVGAADIQTAALDAFDVLIQPGGSAASRAKTLGPDGREAIRQFIRRGGGYIGICAGAYLATTGYTWSLDIVSARTIDREHWKRGKGTVQVELTEAGKRLLGDRDGLVAIHYANGPLLAVGPAAATQPAGSAAGPATASGQVAVATRPAVAIKSVAAAVLEGNKTEPSACEVLACYRSEMTLTGPVGVMKDTPAIVAGTFGKGRVICFSPHPEASSALTAWVHKAVLWAAGRNP